MFIVAINNERFDLIPFSGFTAWLSGDRTSHPTDIDSFDRKITDTVRIIFRKKKAYDKNDIKEEDENNITYLP